MSGTTLYAGGDFTTAGGVPANYIAKWNGSAWSALGSGMDSVVYALAVSGTHSLRWGRVHHGGRGDGQLHCQMERQRLVGLGLGDERRLAHVYALAVSGTTLYAGGELHHGGRGDGQLHRQLERQRLVGLGLGDGRRLALRLCAGGERDHSLRWGRVHHGGRGDGQLHRRLERQRLVGLGLGDETAGSLRLAADGSGHLFVGGVFSLAGTNVSPFIAQANIGAGLSAGRLGSLVYSPATGFGCTFSDATIGQPYHIQSSPSLAAGSWTNFTNFTYTGPMVISDRSAAAGPKKFYRAVSP